MKEEHGEAKLSGEQSRNPKVENAEAKQRKNLKEEFRFSEKCYSDTTCEP